jgi:hypothetical protein
MIDRTTLAFNRLLPYDDNGVEFWFEVEAQAAKVRARGGTPDLHQNLWEARQRIHTASGESLEAMEVRLWHEISLECCRHSDCQAHQVKVQLFECGPGTCRMLNHEYYNGYFEDNLEATHPSGVARTRNEVECLGR